MWCLAVFAKGVFVRASAIVATLSLVMFGTVGLAQETTGNLEGRLLDGNGDPIPTVEIMVTNPSLQGSRGIVASATGGFRLLQLPVGEYRVEISHVGYQSVVLGKVQVRLGRPTHIGDVRLEVKTHVMRSHSVRSL